ncbi:hypothetical protein B0H63DRAFT_85984 [Podospora didyma]|uniref:Zn(2)-C6 fungal-type domain-containing protein n=1 Tax=Podospora didyma TaxID=330526 RepID=A0AAE0K0L2_9PEZI|nr:hypothetical protein B0H63DRAFT_85984 [Podospora didyma]
MSTPSSFSPGETVNNTAAQTPLTVATPEPTSSLKSPAPTPTLLFPHGYPRRTHKKSRTGCMTCKARKIKCDERHPSCLNCIAHGVECPFLSIKPGATPILSSSSKKSRSPKPVVSPSSTATLLPSPHPSGSPTTPAPLGIIEQPNDDLPLLELELLHNFTILTYSTLAADASVCDFWRVTVVRIGLGCDYIMRSVLAVSALHLAYHRPEKRDFYTAQGIVLHQRASRSAMRAMAPESGGGLTDNLDDAVNLFLFSMLTVYFALASPRRSLADGSFFIGESESEAGGKGSASGGSFPDWTFLLAGSKSLSKAVGDRGHETPLAPFLAYGHGRWSATRGEEDDGEKKVLGGLRQRVAGANAVVADAALAETYTHALDELELSLVARQDPSTPRDVLDAMLWLWEVSDSLVLLLKGPEPAQEAVAIFAHFCILLRHHESVWWLQGWADHLISQAYVILDEEHRPWIDWPMKEMGRLGGMQDTVMM